jgi:hypothetical protein
MFHTLAHQIADDRTHQPIMRPIVEHLQRMLAQRGMSHGYRRDLNCHDGSGFGQHIPARFGVSHGRHASLAHLAQAGISLPGHALRKLINDASRLEISEERKQCHRTGFLSRMTFHGPVCVRQWLGDDEGEFFYDWRAGRRRLNVACCPRLASLPRHIRALRRPKTFHPYPQIEPHRGNLQLFC